MKRIITIFLIIQAGLSIGQVLPEDQDLLRYWYYRDRLVKDFTLGIGDGFGQSLIFGSREAKLARLIYNRPLLKNCLFM